MAKHSLNNTNLTLVKSDYKGGKSRVEKLLIANLVLTAGLYLLILLGR